MAIDNSTGADNIVPITEPSPNPKDDARAAVSQTNSSEPAKKDNSHAKANIITAKDFILTVAHKLSAQPLQNSDPGVWGVLTAISKNARQRPQGMNILLDAGEHCLGRSVEDTRFQIEAIAISAKHCKIYRKNVTAEDVEQRSSHCIPVFLKDTSTNGTYLNWEKLKKHNSEAKLQHGDIISFVHPPHHQLSFAFVYREVRNPASSVNGAVGKRKSEELAVDSKRLKGIGIGAPEGPISLDDVRSLQRSNTELRKQLESHVLTIETIRNETRAAVTQHENELKELKESVSRSYLDKMEELRHLLEAKQKELVEVSTVSAERQQFVGDLNERLTASMQSRVDADEVINSQKATISELQERLDEERNQRREEREKAVADLKAALQRAHLEAQEEIKRQSDVALRQQREQQEVINKLQESDKESRILVETSRFKLEDIRESLVMSEKKVRQLEAQVHEEQLVSANGRKKAEILELEAKRLRKELESEKVAREEAWAKVSALELEMATAVRELSIEKQRLQGARERVILRETQLRAFYSTTEEITALFTKQQEQLKAMQKTLEDEDNYQNTSVDFDLNVIPETTNRALVREREESHPPSNKTARDASPTSTPKNLVGNNSTSDDASITEKHNCDIRTQEDTQEAECMSADRTAKGFGSDIDGVGTAPFPDGDAIDTERVLGTESPYMDEHHIALHKCSNLAGDTMQMQIDDETQVRENGDQGNCSQSNNLLGVLENTKPMEDTEPGTIRTADLLTSEVAGSWAVSTAPSVHGENESPRSGGHAGTGNDEDSEAAALLCALSDGQAAGSQNIPHAVTDTERRALNQMIDIVAPDFKEQFRTGEGADESGSMTDADTEEGSNHGGDDGDRDDVVEVEENDDDDDDVVEVEENDDDDATEDSVG